MNNLISSVPSASPFFGPFGGSPVSPFGSSFGSPFGFAPFTSPFVAQGFGQIGSPVSYTGFGSTPQFGFGGFSPVASGGFGTFGPTSFGQSSCGPTQSCPLPFGFGQFETPLGSQYAGPFGGQPFGQSFGQSMPTPFGFGFGQPTPLGGQFGNQLTTQFGGFGQPTGEWSGFGGRLGSLPTTALNTPWSGTFTQPFGQSFSQGFNQSFGAPGFGFPTFGSSMQAPGFPSFNAGWTSPFGFGNSPSPFMGSLGGPIGSGFTPWNGSSSGQWGGQFSQPFPSGSDSANFAGANGGIPGFCSPIQSTTTSSSGTPNGISSGSTTPSNAPISPITGSTPSTGSGLPNPTLNQFPYGTVPGGASFPGISGLGNFGGPIGSSQFAGQSVGQLPSQPFGGTGTLVTNGQGQPIFQQSFYPYGFQPGTAPTQFATAQQPGWTGQGETRSGTTINVSQREAA